MTTPTPEELRRYAAEHLAEAAQYVGMPMETWERKERLTAAALSRWADELERESPTRPHDCRLHLDYSGRCGICERQVFTRNAAGEISAITREQPEVSP
jgi:hypothetical protein